MNAVSEAETKGLREGVPGNETTMTGMHASSRHGCHSCGAFGRLPHSVIIFEVTLCSCIYLCTLLLMLPVKHSSRLFLGEYVDVNKK